MKKIIAILAIAVMLGTILGVLSYKIFPMVSGNADNNPVEIGAGTTNIEYFDIVRGDRFAEIPNGNWECLIGSDQVHGQLVFDTETGVEYLMSSSGAVPLYNTDGTPKFYSGALVYE